MTLPVVFVHFGPCAYAACSTAQARHFGNAVWFLTDQPDAAPFLGEIARVDSTRANPPRGRRVEPPALTAFADFYRHMSTNHFEFELQCFLRWFVLCDMLHREALAACLYLDTDVLLYANAADEWPYYAQFDFTLALGTTGHTSFWHIGALAQFCEFLLRTYRDRDANFRELERIYAEMREQNLAGGVSDMLLLKLFREQSGLNVGEMTEIRDGATWDHNLNSSDGYTVNAEGRKCIAWPGDAGLSPIGYHEPTRSWVRFKSLHFQGQAKFLMESYALRAEALAL